MERFRQLGLPEQIIRVVQEENFEKPTEIQEKTIPMVLAGKDVIAGSATGSGKTLVFGAGIIVNCERGKGIQAIVLTPTRELAEQVGKALMLFSKYKPLSIAIVYGGVGIEAQMRALHYADVVVGTPGRILDHMERGTINLQGVKIAVLDEADRMLDMGFIDDVNKIIGACRDRKQTLLFSATITKEVKYLSQRFMRTPEKVSAEPQVDPKLLAQYYYNVQKNLKFSLLVHLMRTEESGLVMVFCNSRHMVDFVADNLNHNGIEAMAIHGGFSQDKRNKVIEQFHSAKVYVLVCTDVAARGLDIPGVSHVYNYDLPKDSKQYIHRIGRTARAGEKGKAVNLLDDNDHENFSRVLRDNDVKVQKIQTPYVPAVATVRVSRDRKYNQNFGRPGFGPSGGHSGAGRSPRSFGQSHGRSFGSSGGRDSGRGPSHGHSGSRPAGGQGGQGRFRGFGGSRR